MPQYAIFLRVQLKAIRPNTGRKMCCSHPALCPKYPLVRNCCLISNLTNSTLTLSYGQSEAGPRKYNRNYLSIDKLLKQEWTEQCVKANLWKRKNDGWIPTRIIPWAWLWCEVRFFSRYVERLSLNIIKNVRGTAHGLGSLKRVRFSMTIIRTHKLKSSCTRIGP